MKLNFCTPPCFSGNDLPALEACPDTSDCCGKSTSPTINGSTATSPTASLQSGESSFDKEPELLDDEGSNGEACLACNYLHWFMLERLPSALEEVKSQVSDKSKLKSIDNALEYVKASHWKMMLYQAHTMRVVNQQEELEKYRKYLFQVCEKQKNTEPTHLYVVMDFKMKWEAMYQREKTTDHFGKRGISWHGNRLEFYVWNPKTEKVELCVIKIDQILAGTNKQDGLTVVALLEALQAYCQVEFPGADISFLQSDNASYYQSKLVVLSIPMLNAVCTF
jgi:hypothetical protein